MKHVWKILCTGLLLPGALAAQSIAPEVVAGAGACHDGTPADLSWTAGEAATAAYSGSSAMLTEGFQQPRLVVTSVDGPGRPDWSFTIYPNPVGDALHIRPEGPAPGAEVEITIFDLAGKRVLTRKDRLDGNPIRLNCTALAAGRYLLQISGRDAAFRFDYQIQKHR